MPAARAKYQEAERLYEAALKAPQKANIRQGYAILLMRNGEFERAKTVMQEISRMKDLTESDWFELRMNYSVCLWRLGRLDDAIATAQRALNMRKSGALYSTLGMYLVEKAAQTGDFTEIERFNREAMDYDDEDAGILDNVGAMYEAMSRRDADPAARAQNRALAKQYYEKAHAIKPRQIVTKYNLARLYHEDGEDDAARKTLAASEDLYYSGICPIEESMMEELKREVG